MTGRLRTRELPPSQKRLPLTGLREGRLSWAQGARGTRPEPRPMVTSPGQGRGEGETRGRVHCQEGGMCSRA